RDSLLLANLERGRLKPAPIAGQRFIFDSAVLADVRIEPAVQKNLENALNRLAREGAIIKSRPVSTVQNTFSLIERYGWLGAPEALAIYEPLLATEKAERMDPRVKR